MSIVLRCGKRGCYGYRQGYYHTIGSIGTAVELAKSQDRSRSEDIGYGRSGSSGESVNYRLAELLDNGIATVGRSPCDSSADNGSNLCH